MTTHHFSNKNQACLVYLSLFLCRKAHGPGAPTRSSHRSLPTRFPVEIWVQRVVTRHPGPRREAGSIQLLGLRFSPGSDGCFFGGSFNKGHSYNKKNISKLRILKLIHESVDNLQQYCPLASQLVFFVEFVKSLK